MHLYFTYSMYHVTLFVLQVRQRHPLPGGEVRAGRRGPHLLPRRRGRRMVQPGRVIRFPCRSGDSQSHALSGAPARVCQGQVQGVRVSCCSCCISVECVDMLFISRAPKIQPKPQTPNPKPQ